MSPEARGLIAAGVVIAVFVVIAALALYSESRRINRIPPAPSRYQETQLALYSSELRQVRQEPIERRRSHRQRSWTA